jgi:hypothetical protein
MAGLAPISLQQFSDLNGRPQGGAKAYFLEADTLNPILTYRDYGLGSTHPYPVEADAYGRFSAIFIDEAVGFYRLRITTAAGVVVTDLTTLPVIGPGVSSGGSEVPVDPDAVFKTGYPLWLPVAGSLSGFVRYNGRTIGSASSGASERANADCQALYEYIYGTYSDTYCPVTGGRGASVTADWAANKPIAVLSMRNRAPFGLADMGNSDTGAFATIPFTLGNATTAAAQGGEALHTLVTAELAAHSHGITDPGHTHPVPIGPNFAGSAGSGGMTGGSGVTATSNTTGITVNNAGSGTAHNTVPPMMLGTWYVKL